MSRVELLVLRAGDRERLSEWTRSSRISAGAAQRARILVLAADGASHAEIGRRVGVSLPTVRFWRERYRVGGVGNLGDLPRSGRPPTVDETSVISATLDPPPPRLGVTHWSARLLADHLGISFATVARIWRRWGLQPWKAETFTFSTDPELDAKIRDVVGLYLDPPERAVVLCVDEKTQIQALDRTAPILPLRPGIPEKQTHDYRRHGTTSLFAALEIATGKVTDRCYARHTDPNVKIWLAKNPRITLHFTPTSGSWLNMVEIFFGIITRQAIRRGTFHSVHDLEAAIGEYIDGWNDRAHPFVCTTSADHLIAHSKPSHRKITSYTRH